VKKGGRDGEVRGEDPENQAVLGSVSPGDVNDVLSSDVLVLVGTRIGLCRRLVGVY